MNTFTAPCIHISTYYRKLKSLPIDQVTIIPSKPYAIDFCVRMELIGRNLEEIISNIEVSNNPNHFNRLCCEQYAVDSYSPVFVYWNFGGRSFLFEFNFRNAVQYNSIPIFSVDYELHQMWEIVGTTNSLLNMMGIDDITYKELEKYMLDFEEDFVLLKSVY